MKKNLYALLCFIILEIMMVLTLFGVGKSFLSSPDGFLEALRTNGFTEIDSVAKASTPGYNTFLKLFVIYQDTIDWEMKYTSPNENVVMKMDNGYLTFAEDAVEEKEICEIADSIKDFDSFLKEKNIGFYYINAGSKVCPWDKQLSGVALLNEHTNENADRLLEALNDRSVRNVDMRSLMREDDLDWYSCYYAYDHHWTTRTQLWCARKIAELLNHNGFDYDLDKFAENRYNITTYDDFWFGNQARIRQFVGCRRENFEVILPSFDTGFEVDIPGRSLKKQGNYQESLFRQDLLEEFMGYEDADFLNNNPYYLVNLNNDATGMVVNKTAGANRNKKILMLYDSFGWYVASFLSCDTGEVDVVYLPDYKESTGRSIREYVNDINPNVVIMMYCEKNIKAADGQGEVSIFDLY